MNKELQIFAVVAFFTGLLYWGVEPFAHSQMHKHVESHGFIYDGAADVEEVDAKILKLNNEAVAQAEQLVTLKAEKSSDKVKENIKGVEARIASIPNDIKTLEALKLKKEEFWAGVAKISKMEAHPAAGEAVFATCTGCHTDGASNMGGVIPPVLDHAGSLYDRNYLIALIKDPAMASNVDHKYADTAMHPMGAIKSMVSDDQQIADVVDYIKKNKGAVPTSKVAYAEACGRCHAMRYDKLTQIGSVPETKSNIKTGLDVEALKFKQAVAEEQAKVAEYMGKLPPDLSMMVRARSHHFMETFVENPQSQLAGTSMPRVGLSLDGYEHVQSYLSDIGDPSKPARALAAPWVLGFFIIFTILAYLWKSSQWRDLH